MSEWIEYRPGRWRLGPPAPVRPPVTTHRGAEPDFTKGPVLMYSEPPKGRGPVDAQAYAQGGMVPVFRNMREIREYEAKSKDTARPVEWTR